MLARSCRRDHMWKIVRPPSAGDTRKEEKLDVTESDDAARREVQRSDYRYHPVTGGGNRECICYEYIVGLRYPGTGGGFFAYRHLFSSFFFTPHGVMNASPGSVY
jgi:hypothetical protein